MGNPSELCYHNPRLLILILLLVFFAGLLSLKYLPRQEDPLIGERFGTLFTHMPGASSEVVESQVTQRLEQEIKSIKEVKEIQGVSRPSVSSLTIELHAWVLPEETDTVWAKVSDKISRVSPLLPVTASEPELTINSIAAHALVFSLSLDEQAEQDPALLARYARNIRRALLSLPSTRDIELFGRTEEVVRVDAKVVELAPLGLTAIDIANLIRTHQVRVPAGTSKVSERELAYEIDDVATSSEAIGRLQIPQRSGLTVRDVADVQLTLQSPAELIATHNATEVILIGIRPTSGVRVDKWVQSTLKLVQEAQAGLPETAKLELVFNQADYIEKRFDTLSSNLLIALLLVFPILILLQGSKAAALTVIAVPITMLAMVAMMNPIGVELHQMSVTGMIIALGIMIDNPIVIIDRYRHNESQGLLPAQAITATTTELRIPLLISSLTTMFAFFPIASSNSASGEFVGPMAAMVIVAVFFSYLVSILVLPAIAGHLSNKLHFLPDTKPLSHAKVEALYKSFLHFVVKRPWWGIAFSFILPLVGFLTLTIAPTQFFPPVDRDMFQVEIRTPTGHSVDATLQVAQEVDAFLGQIEGIQDRYWTVGGLGPRIYYNLISAAGQDATVARAFVYTESQTYVRDNIRRLQRDIVEKFPGVRLRLSPFQQGPPIFAEVEVKVWGDNIQRLRQIGSQFRYRMSNLDTILYSAAGLDGTDSRLLLQERRAEVDSIAAWANVPQQLRAAVDGINAGSILDAGLDIPITVYIAEAQHYDAVQLLSLPILNTAQGGPLAPISVVEPSLSSSPSSIVTINSERVNLVQAWLQPYSLASEAEQQLAVDLERDPVEVPDGYSWTFGGASEQSGEAISNLLQTAVFFTFLIIGALVLGLRSFSYTGIILGVVVLAAGLAFFGIFLSGEPRGFVGIVGIIGLSGLAINDSVIVLSEIRNKIQEKGFSNEVIVNSVFRSSRHVLATTLTTIASFTPLMISIDTFWIPLAYAMAGGITGATLIAVALIPAVVVLFERRKQKATA